MRYLLLLAACTCALVFLAPRRDSTPATVAQLDATTKSEANELIRRQPGFSVPNLGQWDHPARFVHRSGPMTLFLEDRGWVIDLVERPIGPKTEPHAARHAMPDDPELKQNTRGVALRMTFEGDRHVPEIVGEKKLPGHHNYFLGNDESRWRTDVPLYSAVRYEHLYPGIDLRLREADGVPEYDVLLQPGADLSRVSVRVEGAKSLSIAGDGSLVIATALGWLTQSVPDTWQVDPAGRKQAVVCNFTLLGADRFGFEATGWGGDTSLTIDPGLIWSTFVGGSGTNSYDIANAVDVDSRGLVTVTGFTSSTNFPTTSGAYNTNNIVQYDAFVSRLDPSKAGTAQLLYSTFLGGTAGGDDWSTALSVDASGVVTIAGWTSADYFPTTSGAYNRTHRGGGQDAFVSRLDPSLTGAAQLVYSTLLGGGREDSAVALSIDASGVIAVAGNTRSTDFPMSSGAFDTTYNGGNRDAFVSRLDPSKRGAAQLVYSTLLGGVSYDWIYGLSVDANGVVTVAGTTWSADFPSTSRAYDPTYNGNRDAFVSRLDPKKTGTAQLVYSTFLGGNGDDGAYALSVDANGVVTVVGSAFTNFPTTRGAYDTTFNGGSRWGGDAFVSRLDPSKSGIAQLVYSTYLGGTALDYASAVAVDASGMVTVVGSTTSNNFPTTSGAYDTTYNGNRDAFVSRLLPLPVGRVGLIYSTFLGGSNDDYAPALSVDASGVPTVAGWTRSANFPTTSGAYDTTYNGGYSDAFISRLDMGIGLYGDVHEVLIRTGGKQGLAVNAGKAHANRLYWIFGSVTGTRPGLTLPNVHIPLNPDLYTSVAMAAVNTTVFTKFRGTLDANGLATASFVVPATLPVSAGFTFHHAYVVYDANGRFYMASNAVPLTLIK